MAEIVKKEVKSESSDPAKQTISQEPLDIEFEINQIEKEITESVRQETQKKSQSKDATDDQSENVAVTDMLKDANIVTDGKLKAV